MDMYEEKINISSAGLQSISYKIRKNPTAGKKNINYTNPIKVSYSHSNLLIPHYIYVPHRDTSAI